MAKMCVKRIIDNSDWCGKMPYQGYVSATRCLQGAVRPDARKKKLANNNLLISNTSSQKTLSFLQKTLSFYDIMIA
jgi:hypothetical protein